jgi:hypothetical protein
MITLKKVDGALQEAKQINFEPTFDADRRVQHFDADRLETRTHVILARGEACFESFRLVPTQYLLDSSTTMAIRGRAREPIEGKTACIDA